MKYQFSSFDDTICPAEISSKAFKQKETRINFIAITSVIFSHFDFRPQNIKEIERTFLNFCFKSFKRILLKIVLKEETMSIERIKLRSRIDRFLNIRTICRERFIFVQFSNLCHFGLFIDLSKKKI